MSRKLSFDSQTGNLKQDRFSEVNEANYDIPVLLTEQDMNLPSSSTAKNISDSKRAGLASSQQVFNSPDGGLNSKSKNIGHINHAKSPMVAEPSSSIHNVTPGSRNPDGEVPEGKTSKMSEARTTTDCMGDSSETVSRHSSSSSSSSDSSLSSLSISGTITGRGTSTENLMINEMKNLGSNSADDKISKNIEKAKASDVSIDSGNFAKAPGAALDQLLSSSPAPGVGGRSGDDLLTNGENSVKNEYSMMNATQKTNAATKRLQQLNNQNSNNLMKASFSSSMNQISSSDLTEANSSSTSLGFSIKDNNSGRNLLGTNGTNKNLERPGVLTNAFGSSLSVGSNNNSNRGGTSTNRRNNSSRSPARSPIRSPLKSFLMQRGSSPTRSAHDRSSSSSTFATSNNDINRARSRSPVMRAINGVIRSLSPRRRPDTNFPKSPGNYLDEVNSKSESVTSLLNRPSPMKGKINSSDKMYLKEVGSPGDKICTTHESGFARSSAESNNSAKSKNSNLSAPRSSESDNRRLSREPDLLLFDSGNLKRYDPYNAHGLNRPTHHEEEGLNMEQFEAVMGNNGPNHNTRSSDQVNQFSTRDENNSNIVNILPKKSPLKNDSGVRFNDLKSAATAAGLVHDQLDLQSFSSDDQFSPKNNNRAQNASSSQYNHNTSSQARTKTSSSSSSSSGAGAKKHVSSNKTSPGTNSSSNSSKKSSTNSAKNSGKIPDWKRLLMKNRASQEGIDFENKENDNNTNVKSSVTSIATSQCTITSDDEIPMKNSIIAERIVNSSSVNNPQIPPLDSLSFSPNENSTEAKHSGASTNGSSSSKNRASNHSSGSSLAGRQKNSFLLANNASLLLPKSNSDERAIENVIFDSLQNNNLSNTITSPHEIEPRPSFSEHAQVCSPTSESPNIQNFSAQTNNNRGQTSPLSDSSEEVVILDPAFAGTTSTSVTNGSNSVMTNASISSLAHSSYSSLGRNSESGLPVDDADMLFEVSSDEEYHLDSELERNTQKNTHIRPKMGDDDGRFDDEIADLSVLSSDGSDFSSGFEDEKMNEKLVPADSIPLVQNHINNADNAGASKNGISTGILKPRRSTKMLQSDLLSSVSEKNDKNKKAMDRGHQTISQTNLIKSRNQTTRDRYDDGSCGDNGRVQFNLPGSFYTVTDYGSYW